MLISHLYKQSGACMRLTELVMACIFGFAVTQQYGVHLWSCCHRAVSVLHNCETLQQLLSKAYHAGD